MVTQALDAKLIFMMSIWGRPEHIYLKDEDILV